MAGLLARFRSALTGKPPSSHRDQQKDAGSIEVKHPSTFSILTSQYGFYTTIIGNIDDQLPLTLPQKLVVSAVEKAMQDQDKRGKAVPRLPSVVPRLLQSLKNPKSSARDYVNIINKDPALTASVLKLANSAYFNPVSKRISSIEIAVVKLGIDGLRTVLSAAVMQPLLYRESNYYSQFGQLLWSHSLCCAVSCEIIARRKGLEPFKAYLLGLVHDMGKITLFSELSKQFGIHCEGEKPGYAAFAPLMQSNSEALSLTIAQDWQLPQELCQALQEQVNLTDGQWVSTYGHMLYQANLACELYAIVQKDPTQADAARQALKDMGLPENLFSTLSSIEKQI